MLRVSGCFPALLFKAYAEKKITRAEFIQDFALWQKSPYGSDYISRTSAESAERQR